MSDYLFTSGRLGFRNWQCKDIPQLAEINNDDEVMEYFPKKPSLADTQLFVKRMQNFFERNGFCYFAVDILNSKEFIGFLGLYEKTFQSDFTPCIDIGWRFKKNAWNKGFATEGAKSCMDYGFTTLMLEKIYSIAPIVNTKSEKVMQKIGMNKTKTFEHPQLQDYPILKSCVLYGKNKK